MKPTYASDRADEIAQFDAFCRRQLARIHQYLRTQEKRRIQLRDLVLREQPDVWQARGHAMGQKHLSLSEMDGDRE